MFVHTTLRSDWHEPSTTKNSSSSRAPKNWRSTPGQPGGARKMRKKRQNPRPHRHSRHMVRLSMNCASRTCTTGTSTTQFKCTATAGPSEFSGRLNHSAPVVTQRRACERQCVGIHVAGAQHHSVDELNKCTSTKRNCWNLSLRGHKDDQTDELHQNAARRSAPSPCTIREPTLELRGAALDKEKCSSRAAPRTTHTPAGHHTTHKHAPS